MGLLALGCFCPMAILETYEAFFAFSWPKQRAGKKQCTWRNVVLREFGGKPRMAKQKGRRQVYRPRYSAFYSPTRGYPIALGDQYGYECTFLYSTRFSANGLPQDTRSRGMDIAARNSSWRVKNVELFLVVTKIVVFLHPWKNELITKYSEYYGRKYKSALFWQRIRRI